VEIFRNGTIDEGPKSGIVFPNPSWEANDDRKPFIL